MSIFAASALLALTGGANANGDFSGSVKVYATYNFPSFPDYNNMHITADVVYDVSGPSGKAWGTFSYLRPGDANVEAYQVYAYATCVGKFSNNQYTIAGPIVKQSGTEYAVGAYLVMEFDVTNGLTHGYPVPDLKAARAACKSQSGTWAGTIAQGYVIAQ